MMRSLLRWMVLPLLLVLPVNTMQAQKVEWNLSAHAFIDNSEGNHHYAVNQTLTGLRLTPEIGISSHEATHRIMLGATGLSEWGNKGKISGLAVTAYYRYQKNGFKFTIGSFMRSTLEEEMESYLLSDSLKYYRPLMQGMHLSHTSSTHLLEAYLDWTGMRRGVSNEQFMLGMNAWNRWGNFKAGLKGYYYHYAFSGKRTNDDHIRDHALIRPFVSYSFTPSGILKDLEIKAGALIGLDRKRASVHEKEQGIKGYRNINRKAMEKLQPGGLLFTFSCSQAISNDDFKTIAFSAAALEHKNVRIVHQMQHAIDHPVSIYHPEGNYLKGLLLAVE